MKKYSRLLQVFLWSLILGYLVFPFVIAVLIVLATILAVILILFSFLGLPGAFALQFSREVDTVTTFFLNADHYLWLGLLGMISSVVAQSVMRKPSESP